MGTEYFRSAAMPSSGPVRTSGAKPLSFGSHGAANRARHDIAAAQAMMKHMKPLRGHMKKE